MKKGPEKRQYFNHMLLEPELKSQDLIVYLGYYILYNSIIIFTIITIILYIYM